MESIIVCCMTPTNKRREPRQQTWQMSNSRCANRWTEKWIVQLIHQPTTLAFQQKLAISCKSFRLHFLARTRKKWNCYAILDNGSTISYVLDTTANGINAPKAIQFDLNVMHAFDQSVINANLVLLDIGRYKDDEPLFRLNYVHSINNWKFSDAPVQELNETCATYSHLQHINFPNLGNNKIQLLLGVDATQFILERKFLQGPTGNLFAIRNLLGWTITGPMKRKAEESYQAETDLLSHSYRPFDKALTCSTFHDDKPLCDYVTSFWKIDNAGTEPEEPKNFSKELWTFSRKQFVTTVPDMKLVFCGRITSNYKTIIQ